MNKELRSKTIELLTKKLGYQHNEEAEEVIYNFGHFTLLVGNGLITLVNIVEPYLADTYKVNTVEDVSTIINQLAKLKRLLEKEMVNYKKDKELDFLSPIGVLQTAVEFVNSIPSIVGDNSLSTRLEDIYGEEEVSFPVMIDTENDSDYLCEILTTITPSHLDAAIMHIAYKTVEITQNKKYIIPMKATCIDLHTLGEVTTNRS